MCNQCEIDHDHENNWDGWDGKTEIHEIYVEHGNVIFVEQDGETPAGVETQWAVYGHLKAGGVFWIADFSYAEHDSALSLAHSLEDMAFNFNKAKEHMAEAQKEIERLTECLEKPVGYVNQGRLAELRDGSVIGGASLSPAPDSYHNCAIYAQD